MDKPVIAIDIDEVLFPMMDEFLAFHNSEYGTALRLHEMKSYYVEHMTGETEEEMLAKLEQYVNTHHYKKAQPLRGAAEGIRKLREKYSLVVLTSRQAFYRGSTEIFIGTHFKDMFEQLHYTHFLESPDITRPKHVICKELNAIALIDDSLRNVTDCASNGIEGVLFGDYPWNRATSLPKDVTRCKDWPQVVEYFNAES